MNPRDKLDKNLDEALEEGFSGVRSAHRVRRTRDERIEEDEDDED